jgi:hypothetical protein
MSLVGLWLGLGLPDERSGQLLENDGKPLSPRSVAAFSKAVSYGLRQEDVLTTDDAFAYAANYLRTQCPADSKEIEILDTSKSNSSITPTPNVIATARHAMSMAEC